MRRFLILVALIVFSPLGLTQNFETIPNWRYIPLDKGAYENALAFIEAGQIDEAYEAIQAIRSKGKNSSVEAEAQVLLAQLCGKLGLIFCEFELSVSAAVSHKGSVPALKGLEIIEKSLRSSELDDSELVRLINSASIQQVPQSLEPMFSYYVAMDNFEKDLVNWGLRSQARLGKRNYWFFKWKFNSMLEAANRGAIQASTKNLEKMAGMKGIPLSLRVDALWQAARLRFELNDYRGSLKLYSRLNLSDHKLMGQVLREKAWVSYWLKSYAETLGTIRTLKAPHYQEAMHPEIYLLEMLTLRKLCHFGSVKEVTQDFEKRYAETYEHIKSRKPLSDNLALVRMAFLKARFGKKVQSLRQLRSERLNLKNGSSKIPDKLSEELVALYDRSEKSLRDRLEIELKEELRSQGEIFLDLREQVQLVDYLSGVDAFSIKQSYEKKDYKAKSASALSYNKLFWPVNEEYWSSELNSYQVLVSDKCSEGGN